ncbi:hypothetical protein SG34_024110 [Thalassomonas viridans]|uniref:EF-hand domain-containing protein n=1 Tax=Thalassomonas viridans TaxID=137584 RepID=A0AAF0C6N5_9GAMM|nr:hypothetical protein [Thalassomonas viridans]WDE04392.1 hypothetical protein SG34_024110 [Thalassomonas viridans]
MKTNQSFFLLTALLLSAGVYAMDSNEKFTTLDHDNNGFITQDEAGADSVLAVTFKKWDKDKNGRLSKEEYNEYHNEI